MTRITSAAGELPVELVTSRRRLRALERESGKPNDSSPGGGTAPPGGRTRQADPKRRTAQRVRVRLGQRMAMPSTIGTQRTLLPRLPYRESKEGFSPRSARTLMYRDSMKSDDVPIPSSSPAPAL